MIDLCVIGAGAAGMLASAMAAESGMEVLLFERNSDFGKKLRITGKGRCNVTNDCLPKDVIANVPTNGRFLYSAVYGFTPSDVMAMFENLGVPLKTERGNRVFPVSDKAENVVSALRKYVRSSGVKTVSERVCSILCENGEISGVKTEKGVYACKRVLLCTGGLSYPRTGSTGDGYSMAKKLGHTIVKPAPSLVPLESEDRFCGEMQGLSLRNVGLRAFDDKKRLVYEDFGEMLFTHFGVSGPLILSASSHMRNYDKNKYHLVLDLKPALDEKKLDARLLRDFAEMHNKNYVNLLPRLVNGKMVPVIARLTGIPEDTKVNSITKEQRTEIIRVLKNFRINITGPRPVDEAIVTSGGVNVKEINPSTMESKIVPGLYFAGEIIDVDGYTGGFNLQIAWSTAHLAAESIKESYYAE